MVGGFAFGTIHYDRAEKTAVLKKFLTLAGCLIFLAGSAGACVLLEVALYAARPAASQGVEKIVEIRPGQNFARTAQALEQAGIIDCAWKFKLLGRLKRWDKRLKAGEFMLSASMPPMQILKTLVAGQVRLHRFTVPEGLTLFQIADLAAAAGFGSREAFVAAAGDLQLARTLGIQAPTLEGYLFPDTYYFPRGARPRQIITTMVRRFHEVWQPAWHDRAQQAGLSDHQVVILASIIEKETGSAPERPIISSVFHNRLKKGMRLESDPTVIYGIEDFDGNLTRRHLSTPGPYNTYKIKGLPQGPIANPGRASLEAALYPAQTDFFFFVSKKDRTHQFSTNIRDHNRAVRKYQLRR